MQIGVVSDTHDDQELVAAAIDVFEDRGVDAVVHCGDFVAPFSAAQFDGDYEFYAVRGNNDGEWALASVVEEFGEYLGEMGELRFDGADVAVYHGTSGPIVDALVACGEYDYVLHGHTHEQGREEVDGTVRINPGGLSFAGAPDPLQVALLDTETGETEFVEPGNR